MKTNTSEKQYSAPRFSRRALAVACGFALSGAITAHGEFLFDSYLVPSFFGSPDTEFSEWNVMYAPGDAPNFPDAAAPNGTPQSASAAGESAPFPGAWQPADPIAYWDSGNPTLTQTNPGHFIIGAGTAGNIYSFSNPSAYRLEDATPYAAGTVVFQFQTEGTAVDFDSIRLVYDNGSGPVSLAPDEYVREYRAGAAAFGGFRNRNALQWNLDGLGISEYTLEWESLGSSMSFQEALLDTAAINASVVPASGTWTASGAGNWSDGSNWADGSLSAENANTRFTNTGAAAVTLDGSRAVAEITFGGAGDVVIDGPGTLTANTGITVPEAVGGDHVIKTDYVIGAFNFMDIGAGSVTLEGTVAGDHGFAKSGDGVLVLAADNTFDGQVAVVEGTLRMEGVNTYTGATSIRFGTLEVAADAPSGAPGALGDATSSISLGADGSLFDISDGTGAQLRVAGPHEFGRNVSVQNGAFDNRIGASDTEGGVALFSGNVVLQGGAENVSLFAQGASDTAEFSGGLSGGAPAGTLRINPDGAEGTVVLSGQNKTYAPATRVVGGVLRIANDTEVTGDGDWTVENGAALQLEGVVSGSGGFTLEAGARFGGTGELRRSFTLADGAVVSPGASIGTLTTGSQAWESGGVYLWEIADADGAPGTGWDLLSIDGDLSLTAGSADPFVLQVLSLDGSGNPGTLSGFDPFLDYSWLIASADSIGAFSAEGILIDLDGFDVSQYGDFALATNSGDLILTHTAIPEPAAALWAGLFVMAVAGWRIRRRKSL